MIASGQVETIHRAVDLPDKWDTTAKDRFFLRRNSLRFLEETNPCGQRYHLAGEPGSCSIAVTYKHRLNLLTFGSGALSMPMTVVGIPCSVSSSGCCFAPPTKEALVRHLHGIKGTKLVLNTSDLSMSGFRRGSTLPTCLLENRWDNFSTYLSAMRSPYRYRIKKAQARWASVEESVVKPEAFDENLHQLYRHVFNHSHYKLERLDLGFFRKFPADIAQFTVGGKPIAFVQTVFVGNQLVFMFAGIDYSVCKQYDTYLNILLYIVKKGIDSGCSFIDMGQTAEEIKCKLGCRQTAKHLHVAHSGKVGHLILQSLAGMLSYRQQECEYRVFK